MVVKLLAITEQRTTHSKILGIRKEMNDYVKEFCNSNDFNAVINSMVEGKFQSDLANKVAHITALYRLEVRKLEILPPQGQEQQAQAEKEKKAQ
jgi:ribosomal protein S3AE